jgi:hypothetical protein
VLISHHAAFEDFEMDFDDIELDLPPEYCHYQYNGCEFADSCLDCPFPDCLYAEPGGKFTDNLWHEPVPFNLDSQYGLAIAHYGDYCWLSCPCGVWRAGLAVQSLDLSADVLSLREELGPTGGSLTVELGNEGGGYAALGEGDLSVFDIGGQLDFSPGYVTAQGNETSSGLAFTLDSYEHTSAGGQSGLVLKAADGWSLIKGWRARHQFRWNKDSQEMSVRQILAFVLGRVGLRLEVKSQSSVMAGYYPDFTINPGNSGDTIIRKLLSFVPDVLFIEGSTAWVVNPLADDDSDYGYGPSHPVVEGRYRQAGWGLNRIQVEGYDPAEGEAIVVDTFSWGQIDHLYDKLGQVEDRNLDTVDGSGQWRYPGPSQLRLAAL